MKAKSKKYKFICQVSEDYLKLIKCRLKAPEIEIVAAQVESITGQTDDSQISIKLSEMFKKLQLFQEPIVISLPRSLATLRYLKLPSQDPSEIERIISLQAPRYLPYPAEELITSYSIAGQDTSGYSYVNFIIVHRDVIERYFRILKAQANQIEAIVLSSYGLFNWYKHIQQKKDLGPVMIIDVDMPYTEIAIVLKENLLFSRTFKLPQDETEFKVRLKEEIDKTKDAYLKEAIGKEPIKIILTGRVKEDLEEMLQKEMTLPIESISGFKNIPEGISSHLSKFDVSFTNLLGLGLEVIEDPLNLMPETIKEKKRSLSLKKEYLRIGLSLSGAIILFSLGLTLTFYNRVTYLNKLRLELNRISAEAKTIDEMKKKSEVLQAQALQQVKTTDVIYQLHRLIPRDISLVTLIYEEDNQVILRGQTQDLSSVFKSMPILEKSESFKNAKIRYATKRETQSGEVVDFEIICQIKNHNLK